MNTDGTIVFHRKAKPSTKEILEHAKKFIETYGWRQGKLGGREIGPNSYESACAMGAICAVVHGTRISAEYAYVALYKVVGSSIAGFNDSLGRTKEQVLEAFQEAIDI